MDYETYYKKNKDYSAAHDHMDDCLHHLYEACWHLRQIHEDDADRLEEVMSAAKGMIESWKETIDATARDFQSDNWNEEWEEEE